MPAADCEHDYKPIALEHYRCKKCGKEIVGMLVRVHKEVK